MHPLRRRISDAFDLFFGESFVSLYLYLFLGGFALLALGRRWGAGTLQTLGWCMMAPGVLWGAVVFLVMLPIYRLRNWIADWRRPRRIVEVRRGRSDE